jgi:hypothetical protein
VPAPAARSVPLICQLELTWLTANLQPLQLVNMQLLLHVLRVSLNKSQWVPAAVVQQLPRNSLALAATALQLHLRS